MSIKETLKKIFVKLGENNKPTYAVMAIAVVKGIARPAFTMTDKHADPETKKYTALREGLTEVVAIPTYFACGELASKVADKLKFDHLPTKEAQNYARQNARQNFMFLGVCLAALAVIPALASITIQPFMKKIQEKNTKNKIEDKEHKLDIEDTVEEVFEIKDIETKSPTFEGRSNIGQQLKNNYLLPKIGGMKVGGIW